MSAPPPPDSPDDPRFTDVVRLHLTPENHRVIGGDGGPVTADELPQCKNVNALPTCYQ